MCLEDTLSATSTLSRSHLCPGPSGPGWTGQRERRKKDKDLKEGIDGGVSDSSDLIGMDRKVMVERKMIKVREKIRI